MYVTLTVSISRILTYNSSSNLLLLNSVANVSKEVAYAALALCNAAIFVAVISLMQLGLPHVQCAEEAVCLPTRCITAVSLMNIYLGSLG